jgi:hypothetical protein
MLLRASEQPLPCYCEPGNKHRFAREFAGGISLVITPSAGIPSYVNDGQRMLEGGWLTQGKNPRVRIRFMHPSVKSTSRVCQSLGADDIARSSRRSVFHNYHGPKTTESSARNTQLGAFASTVLLVTTRQTAGNKLFSSWEAGDLRTRKKESLLVVSRGMLRIKAATASEEIACHKDGSAVYHAMLESLKRATISLLPT